MATQAEVAAHLDISDRHLRRLVEKGVIPSGKGHGGVDIDAARVAYIRYQRALIDGAVKPDTAPDIESDDDTAKRLEQERLRLTAAQAEGQELKNDITKRKSVPTEIATFVLSRLSAEIGSILDTLPLTLKRRHPDLEARHIESVQRELAKARNRAATLDERLPGLINEFIDATD